MLTDFSYVWLFVTPWAVARQAPQSMELFRQEYWSGLPFLPPAYLPDTGVEPESLESPALAGGFFTTVPSEKPILLGSVHETDHLVFYPCSLIGPSCPWDLFIYFDPGSSPLHLVVVILVSVDLKSPQALLTCLLDILLLLKCCVKSTGILISHLLKIYRP